MDIAGLNIDIISQTSREDVVVYQRSLKLRTRKYTCFKLSPLSFFKMVKKKIDVLFVKR